jgi:hypothetical protein
MLCIKVYRKTRVGETYYNNKTKSNHKNHEIWEVMDQKPCSTKLDLDGPQSRPPGLHHGPVSPSQCLLALHFVHGQV